MIQENKMNEIYLLTFMIKICILFCAFFKSNLLYKIYNIINYYKIREQIFQLYMLSYEWTTTNEGI